MRVGTRRQPGGMVVLALMAGLAVASSATAAGKPQDLPPAAVAVRAVRVQQRTLTLPTYEQGLPDVNPRFDLFARRPFLIYPYTALTNLTDRRAPVAWRTLELENEYLKLVVLPDLGGRIYSCVDKATGAEMFYANPSIKYADVAYRGAWVALGVEFNFPVSHNWATVSPVDFGTVRHGDGSAAVWVGNIDRPYGMQWRVELLLRPGRSLLEQTTTLYNRSDVRHRFYWWTTASVRADDDSHILYPMELSASHYFADVDTWPVDSSGKDLSYPRNHTAGFVSRFVYGSREPFMGVYHPSTESGMVHVAPHHDLPGKKIWSWGWDDEGKDWRRALSDDQSAYLEVQAGLFRNQETYAFLEPQQLLRFRETYQPVRKIGGYSRANDEGVVHVRREQGGQLRVGLNVTRAVRGGRLVVMDGATTLREEPLDLLPSGTFDRGLPGLTATGPYTVEMRDGRGRVLLSHTEGRYDVVPKAEVKTGPQPARVFPPPEARTEGDWLDLGRHQELNGKRLEAHDVYAAALASRPESPDLLRAAGRLSVELARYDEAVPPLSKAVAARSNDAEALYYLGIARSSLGDTQGARFAWDQAATLPGWRAASLLQLARLTSREGSDLESAHRPSGCADSRPDPLRCAEEGLRLIRQALAESPEMIRAGGMEVALLRRTGRVAEAKARLRYWRSIDPPSSFLRHEAVLLGAVDEGLWEHLAADPERVLELAVDYMALGLWDDAHTLLARRYSSSGVVAEPGTALPQDYPLVSYYRGYCALKAGRSAREDFALASRQSTRYVFPNRADSLVVLRRAVEVFPSDATAHFLLGSLYLSGGRTEEALAEWERARALDPKIPVLHRDVGFTLLYARGAAADALRVFTEGMDADGANVELYQGADQAMSLLGRGAEDRIASLRRYPETPLPSSLVFKLALALAEAGRFAEAEALFPGRFFPREEFGTNVRQVYLEVELRKAFALAREGRKAEAAALAASFGQPVAGFEFTKDGMAAFVSSPRFQYYLGELHALVGDEAAARADWTRAAAGRDFRQAAFAYRAAQKLGEAEDAQWRPLLETALAEADLYLFRGGHYPAGATCARGMLLLSLGRVTEGNEALRQVFFLPDKGMPHHIARLALEEPRGEGEPPSRGDAPGGE
jgi:tetratricopeptide (TPR) repeat protein